MSEFSPHDHFKVVPRKPTYNFRDPKGVYDDAEKELQESKDLTAKQIDKKLGFQEGTIDKKAYTENQKRFLSEMRVDAEFEAHDMEWQHKYLKEMVKRASEELRDFEKKELGMHKE